MKTLGLEGSEMTAQEYRNWMNNPENSHKCEGCPENRECDNWQDRLPCGQWHCWVDCHCREEEE